MAGMFYRINDFAYARSEKQAVGFYLFHTVIVLLGMFLSLVVYGLVMGADKFGPGAENLEASMWLRQTVQVLSVCYIAYLTWQMLAAKNRLRDLAAVASGLAGIMLTFHGLFLGMVMVSGLSILKAKSPKQKGDE